MADRLEGKVAVVTGGASGLGKEMCVRFAAEGAAVVVADINTDDGPKVAAEIERSGGHAVFIETDVRSLAALEAAVAKAVSAFGKLDIMVNNAGIGGVAPIATLDEFAWDIVMDINLKGVFLGMKAAWPALVENGGVILNTASVAGLVATAGFTPYGVAKAGVIQLTKIGALEGAPHNIRVNALCPVWIETPMVEGYLAVAPDPEAARNFLISSVPLGRIGAPSDVAEAALYLASDGGAFITGVALPIDGGTTAGPHFMLARDLKI
jgi:NAD(P)-dependent dehydrogenase (short-subunit alcohol dehydrogenase family)